VKKIQTKPITFGGPTDKGSAYFNFKQDIKKAFTGSTYKDKESITIEISLYILKTRIKPDKNDLDNFLKPVIDALNEENVITEQQVDSIKIDRIKVDRSEAEGVEINIK